VVKKILITLVKVGLSVGILAYLWFDVHNRSATAQEDEGFTRLMEDAWNGPLLALAWVFSAAAVCVTLIRWCYLVRAVGIPLKLKDAFRVGFLGYLFNLAPAGIVGGDVLKGIMLARKHPEYRTGAAASVVIDRMIGLYVLFVVASAAIVVGGFLTHEIVAIRRVCQTTVILTAVGAVGIGILFIPGLSEGRLAQWLIRHPKIGHTLGKLLDAFRIYRSKPRVLATAALMSVGVHCLFTTSIFLIAVALPATSEPDRTPGFGQHFVIAPLSAVASVIPLPAGPQEGTLQYLYRELARASGKGLALGLTYRVITVLIAMVGLVYYLGSRREVAQVLHEAEEV